MADHQTGIGYAHTMSPPGAPPRQPKKLVTIARRWVVYWEPRCVLHAKRENDPVEAFALLKESFTRRSHRLLQAGIPWTTILKGDLDSPLRSGVEFDRALCLAIARRESRMGRVKGKGKKYDSRNRNSR